MILEVAIPLLTLALMLPSSGRARFSRPVAALRIAALAGLGAGVPLLFLLRSAVSPELPALAPVPMAAASALVGCLILSRSARNASVPALLARAADTIVVGAAAASLVLLSQSAAASLGLQAGPTPYVLCVLAGLLVRCTLADAAPLHLGLATCAWLSLVHGLAAGPDGAFLPAMVVLFLVPAGLDAVSPWATRA